MTCPIAYLFLILSYLIRVITRYWLYCTILNNCFAHTIPDMYSIKRWLLQNMEYRHRKYGVWRTVCTGTSWVRCGTQTEYHRVHCPDKNGMQRMLVRNIYILRTFPERVYRLFLMFCIFFFESCGVSLITLCSALLFFTLLVITFWHFTFYLFMYFTIF